MPDFRDGVWCVNGSHTPTGEPLWSSPRPEAWWDGWTGHAVWKCRDCDGYVLLAVSYPKFLGVLTSL
jgi:hypothetical protein